jgi:hypothetical protein
MKTVKLLLLVVVSALTFYACSDNDPVGAAPSTESSIALRTALNEIKKANGLTSRSAADVNPLCFEFVYPITLSLSNGTSVTVTSYQGLLELLENESPATYVNGIAFPFQVQFQGAVQTIADEAGLTQLLISCGVPTWNDNLEITLCFDIVFPIQVVDNMGETVAIDNQQNFLAYLNSPAGGIEADIVFPISVLFEGQVTTIANIYEFYDLLNECNGCACTFEYDPVCIQTANGTVEYGNMCAALCAGFTQSDIVACNPPGNCNISNLTVAVGACNPGTTTYALTIDFDYTNPASAQFQVWNNSTALVGTYALADLPVTIAGYSNNGQGADYLTVNMLNEPSCSAVQQWAVPNCGSDCEGNCPDVFDPVCVQTPAGWVQYINECHALCAGHSPADLVDCSDPGVYNFAEALTTCFDMVYPVQIEFQGAIVTAEAEGQVLQYYNPAAAPMPAFVYPVTVIFGNQTLQANSQADFQNLIINNCN